MNRRVWRWMSGGACLLLAAVLCAGADAQEELAVALLDWSVTDDRYASHVEAEQLHAFIEAALVGQGPVRWIERESLDAAADELMLARLGGSEDPADWLRLGRWVKADLLLTGGVRRQAEGWVVHGQVIDSERADVLSQWSTPPAGDVDSAFTAESVDLRTYLRAARRELGDAKRAYEASRDQQTLAVLFFENRTEVGRRLDHLEQRLMDALQSRCDITPGQRLLRFPAAVEGGDEYRLVLSGLVDAGGAARRVASVYVWGHYTELDWQGVVFEDVPVRLTVYAWDGRGEPEAFTFEGKAGELDQLASQSMEEVSAWAADRPEAVELDPAQSADTAQTIYRRVQALQSIQVGNTRSVTPAFLDRWRNTVRLLETAYFFDPDNAEIHRELTAERWRGDLQRDGHEFLESPRRVRDRYQAVLSHINRFGYGQAWSLTKITPSGGMAVADHRLEATDIRKALLFEGRDMLWAASRGWFKDMPEQTVESELKRAKTDHRRRVMEMLRAEDDPELAEAALWSITRPYTPSEQVQWLEDLGPMLDPNSPDKDRRHWANKAREVYRAAGDEAGAERWLARLNEPEPETPKPPLSDAAESRRERWVDSLRIPDSIRPPQVTLEVADTQSGPPPATDPGLYARRYGLDLAETPATAALDRPAADPQSMWWTTDGGGLIRTNLEDQTTQTFGPEDGLTATRFHAAAETADSLVFLGGEWGESQQLCFYNPESGQWSAIALPPPTDSGVQPIHAKLLAVCGDWIIVAGDDYGSDPQMMMYSLSRETWTDLHAEWITYLEEFPEVLPNKPRRPAGKLLVRALTGDPERGVFWIGSPYGLTRYDPDRDRFSTWFSLPPRSSEAQAMFLAKPRIFEDVTAIAPVGNHLLVATYSWRSASYFSHDPEIGGSYLFLVDAETTAPLRYAKLKHKAPIYRITPRGNEAWLNRQVFDTSHPEIRAVDWSVLRPE
ncbi:hypothetical protein [Algisphaera agarilytica]|uniref:Uncharacterized protein n=1 Tax=Algisphaera agarilytica TaxID=1385975 RepID=A0A7X0H463_9BACT|nr:hypothetical protein [Algisphaera agarilytica]MBB6428758.1 hypothetical protein [Algisphaera agarilytica]